MEIKIELNQDTVDKLLKMKGYTVEKVLVYYQKFHYTREDKYGKFWMHIAYPINDRPKVLDDEIVKMEDVQDMKYDKVVNDLFNKALTEKILC